jgi:hypothetical protein
MTLEQFGFVKRSAAGSSAATPVSSGAMGSSDPTVSMTDEDPAAPPTKRRRFNSDWAKGRIWLKHDAESNVMFCEWCRCFDKNEHRNQFVKGCASMKLESIKKHELSMQHKHSEAAQRARARPDRAPMELALQAMEQDELEQMKRLFNTAFYPVVAERPFREIITVELWRLKSCHWRLSLEISGHHWRLGFCS